MIILKEKLDTTEQVALQSVFKKKKKDATQLPLPPQKKILKIPVFLV